MGIREHFEDFWSVWLAVILTVGLLAGLVVVAAKSEAEHKARFMAQCMQDHKEYECTALWRRGDPSVVAVPIPIIIPSAR
jgi:hypothetical protein